MTVTTHFAGATPGSIYDPKKYERVAGWFLGPKGENEKLFTDLLTTAVQTHIKARQDYFPADEAYIDDSVKAAVQYKEATAKLTTELESLAGILQVRKMDREQTHYN